MHIWRVWYHALCKQKIWSKLRNHQDTCILWVTQMTMQEMYTVCVIYVCNVCGSCVMSSQSSIWKNECRTLHPGCWNSSTCHRNSTGWWRRIRWCKQPWQTCRCGKCNGWWHDSTILTSEKDDILDQCIMYQMKKLEGWFNPAAERYIVCRHKKDKNGKESEVHVNHHNESNNDASKVGKEVANPSFCMHHLNSHSMVQWKQLKNLKWRIDKSTILWNWWLFIWIQFNVRSDMQQLEKNFMTCTILRSLA